MTLWDDLKNLVVGVSDPWVVLGDFNSLLSTADRLGGLPVTAAECADFQAALDVTQLQELQYCGWEYSWCNKQHANLIYTKIDRVFGNLAWFQHYGTDIVEVLNPQSSDHSPLLLSCGSRRYKEQRRFKFLNCVVEHPEYLSAVRRAWDTEVRGVKMFQVWVKMKQVRENLRGLHKVYHHASLKVLSARTDRDRLQSALQLSPLDTRLFSELNLAQKDLDKWYGVEEHILKHK